MTSRRAAISLVMLTAGLLSACNHPVDIVPTRTESPAATPSSAPSSAPIVSPLVAPGPMVDELSRLTITDGVIAVHGSAQPEEVPGLRVVAACASDENTTMPTLTVVPHDFEVEWGALVLRCDGQQRIGRNGSDQPFVAPFSLEVSGSTEDVGSGYAILLSDDAAASDDNE